MSLNLVTEKNLYSYDISGFYKWYYVITSLLVFPELKRIVQDWDQFEIQKEVHEKEDIFFIVHKSQIFNEDKKICAFTTKSMEFISQKQLHSIFNIYLQDAWSEYLI